MIAARTVLSAAGLLVAWVGAPVAFAQTPGQLSAQEALEKMDANRDGRLSYEEISNSYHANSPRQVDSFNRRDANGNQLLEKGELPPLRFGRLDLDKNGSITLDEYQVASSAKARDFVVRTDTNRDGFLTAEELVPGIKQSVANAGMSYEEISTTYYQNPARRKRLFTMLDVDSSGSIEAAEWPDAKTLSAADTNKNGSIQQKEFMDAHVAVTASVIAAVDGNKDGRVTTAEVRQTLKKSRAARAR